MGLLRRLGRTVLATVMTLLILALVMGAYLACFAVASPDFARPSGAFIIGFLATLAFGALPALMGALLHAVLAHWGMVRWSTSVALGGLLGAGYFFKDASLGTWAAGAGMVAAGMVHAWLARTRQR